MNKQSYVGVAVIVVLVVVALYATSTPSGVPTGSENGAVTPDVSPIEEKSVSAIVEEEIKETGEVSQGTSNDFVAPTFNVPDLNRPIVAYVELSDDSKEEVTKEIHRLTEVLRNNDELITSWLVLGVYRKTIGDYTGAEEIWTYVTMKWPSDYVAYNNLGNLYMEYLKDYPKAEQAYKAVIAEKPDYIQGYSNLSDLYRFSYKEKAEQAGSVLEQGLVANPGNFELMLRIARYYGDTGISIEKATQYYQMAIDEANKEGNSDLSSRMQKELEELLK